MAKDQIPYVDETLFPQFLRNVLNQVVDRLNIPQEIRFLAGFEEAPRIEISDERIVFLIPPTIGNGGGTKCQFSPFVASEGADIKLGLQWGTINGQQPTGFVAGGNPPFTASVSGNGYAYAYATFDLSTLQVTSTGILISSNPTLPNTTTTAYRMLCSFAEIEEFTIQIAPGSVCGPIQIGLCELVN